MEAERRPDGDDQRAREMDQDERWVRTLQKLVRTSIDADPWSGADAGRVIGAAFDDEVAATGY